MSGLVQFGLVQFLSLVLQYWIWWVTSSAFAVVLFLIDRFTDRKIPRWLIGATLIVGVAISVFRAWQDEHQKRLELEAKRPHLEIVAVQFDHVPTEMYVDFLVRSPGEPTTVTNWSLSVTNGSRTVSGIKQRGLMTERVVKTPFGGIEHDDLVR